MPVTLVGSAKYTPTSYATTSSVTLPAGIQAGDAIFVHVILASGSATNKATLSGVSGLTEIGEQTFSGHRHTLYAKDDAVSGDASAVLTATTAASLRVTLEVVVFRGDGAAPVVDKQAGVNGSASASTNITSPTTAATTTPAAVEIQFVAGSGNTGVTGFTVPAGLTKVIDSYDTGTGGGHTYGVVAHNLTNQAAGAVMGGDLWTTNTGCLLSAFVVALKVATAPTSVRPSSTISSTGWTNVGGAATLHAALADEVDTTYGETTDGPNGTQVFEFAFPEISATGNITVSTRGKASVASPTIVRTVALRQGASTAIASRTTTLTDAWADHSWTTTTSETALITDRTQLRLRVTDVQQ